MKKLVLLLFVGILPLFGFGQNNLVRWNGANTDFNPVYYNSNIIASKITSQGVNLTNNGQWDAFFQTNSAWPSPSQNNGYLDSNKYIQFTVNPNENYELLANKLNLTMRSQGTATFEIRYSKDASFQNYFSSNGTLNSTFQNFSINIHQANPVADNEKLYIRLYVYNTYNSIEIKHSWGGNEGPVITGVVNITLAPLVVNDNTYTTQNTLIVVNVLENDSYNILSAITVTELPTNGTIQVNGVNNITYSPNSNFTGIDSFKYKLIDNIGISNIGTVMITVNETNPTALVRWNGSNNLNATTLNNHISANPISPAVGGSIANLYQNVFIPNTIWPKPNEMGGYLDPNKYIEFVINPQDGYQLIANKLNLRMRAQGGPGNFEIRYSKDFSQNYFSSNGTLTSGFQNYAINISAANPILTTEILYVRVYIYNTHNLLEIEHNNGGNVGPTITGTVSATTTPCTASTAPLQINGNSNICGGDNVNLQATGGTEGTNATYQWGTGSQIGSNVIVGQTTATLSHIPSATTTYWVRRVNCNNTYTSGITKTVTVAFGDQTTYGTDKWIGYVYTWTGTPAATNYKGYVTENEIFDRSVGYNTIEGVETTLCAPPAEKFLVRYKKKINFAEGNYNITVGGDDGYRISFDGGSTWEIADWTTHSYTTTSKLIALSGTKDVVLEYYEDGGEARVSFSYGIIQGNPTQYGNSVWNVYAFNYYDNSDNQVLVPSSSYSGFYTQNTLGVDTRDIANNGWSDQASPSSSATWTGAPVPNDNFTITHKRQGFPCGKYQIVMSNWDDKAILYINDVQQWVVNGYSGGSFTLPGTFNLNKNSKVELRLKEGGGAAGIKMTLINMPLIQNGTNWVDGVPNNETGIRIDNNYAISSDMEVCSCTVSAGKTLTIEEGKTLTILENIIVEAGAKIIVENNGSLVQIDDNATYTGSIDSFEMKRNTQPVFRLDYTYWSSPVKQDSGFTLSNLSPQTMFNKFLKWNHAGTPQAWQVVSNGNEAMVPGRGYLVRAPQNYNVEGAGAPQEYAGAFIGTPNNGVITHAVSGSTTTNRWNLIGNPYPSAIDAETFLNENSEVLGGTLYFWTHNSAYSNASGYAYTASDYASWNLSGGTGTTIHSENENNNLSEPTGKIAAGQSFFVQGVSEGNATAVFNNSMRVTQGNLNNQFFKPSPSQPVENWEITGKHRVWLNLTSTQNHFNQILVGYIENATNGLDNSYDGGVFSGGAVSLYSILDSKNLTIQGRALPFSNQDEVPLGYKTTLTGTLKISIDHLDGLLEGQNIYIKDNVLNIVHNLKDSDYEFTTVPGTFNDRFVLQYLPQETLGTDVPTLEANSIVVFNNNNQINIKSSEQVISKVEIYDLQGRVIFTKNNIDGQSFATQSLSVKNQLVIVKVITDNNSELVKKVMLK